MSWANMGYFPWPSAWGVTCVSWWLNRPCSFVALSINCNANHQETHDKKNL
jgi:hypothetical protein